MKQGTQKIQSCFREKYAESDDVEGSEALYVSRSDDTRKAKSEVIIF
jgi:hypothetical protein